uniref:Uncharacterized protein n=1 Tax=Setaria digitata TaxID=48799 RepID=A0A915Q218_9BILA
MVLVGKIETWTGISCKFMAEHSGSESRRAKLESRGKMDVVNRPEKQWTAQKCCADKGKIGSNLHSPIFFHDVTSRIGLDNLDWEGRQGHFVDVQGCGCHS